MATYWVVVDTEDKPVENVSYLDKRDAAKGAVRHNIRSKPGMYVPKQRQTKR